MNAQGRTFLFWLLIPLYFCLIYCGPLGIAFLFFAAMPNVIFQSMAFILLPLLYTVFFVLIAGSLSLSHRKSIIAGRFPRELGERIYFHRRLYGFCWTSVYYFTPVYFAALSIPLLKSMMFRLFGYRGSLSFTTYPDTWIRDIPLLELGNGAYLSNKATIGTNIAFADGSILVDSVTIGEGSLVGHLAMIAPGVVLGVNVEVGVGVAIGLKSFLGDDVKINPCCAIEHGVKIGARTKVGSACYIGSGTSIASDLLIPAGITIPPKTKLTCQEEVDFYADHLATSKNRLRSHLKQKAVSLNYLSESSRPQLIRAAENSG